MNDIFSKEKRSEVMSKIRSENTKIELLVFKELRKRGIYFQKHYKKVYGSPDIALPRKKKAVFIDGDFWHGYKTNVLCKNLSGVFWKNKITKNIERDRKINKQLNEIGWKILRIWEHEIKKELDITIYKIQRFLNE